MTRRAALLLAAAILPAGAAAQTAQQSEEITVVAPSPLIGGGVDRNAIPAETQVISNAQLTQNGTPSLLTALSSDVAGINMDNSAGNPFQPALFYNGFEASPLQGTPQGIAVYMNGVRFNQAFGDTVNWDLIPDAAIARVNVEGSNPVFGLNALGGAVNVRLKDGFGYQGNEITLSGGSFHQLEADFQHGQVSADGTEAFYAAGSIIHEGGWRQMQSSDIDNFFADYGRRFGDSEAHLGLTLANSALNGPGTAPVQLLAANISAQFTAPNYLANKYVQINPSANIVLTDTLSVQANAYYSYFQQKVSNGNVANDFPCDDGSGLMCQAPGVYSTTFGGKPIPDFLHGGPYSELDLQDTNTNSYGAALQLSDSGDLFGFHNHFTVGTSFDGAQTTFSAAGFLGGLTLISREYYGPGVIIDEPGNNVPVRVGITDANGGVFATDTLNLTKVIALTVSGRYNMTEVDLLDQNGGDLTGNHAYNRFNPAAGITWRAAPFMTLYAGYAEANRAPTPAELSCAGPQNSCSLANFFVGDPDLKQVVAHTVELGARGRVPLADGWRLNYDLGLFRTDSDDDIQFINSVTLGRAYFANVGQTRRQGLSSRIDVKSDHISFYAAYTYTEATFQSGFVEASGSNPDADANGNLTIRPGDTLPGVPRSTFKAGGSYDVTDKLTVGADAIWQGGQFLFGDEANLTPRLPGFFVMNVRGSYQVTPRLQLFANAQNVTDARYYTYGTFSPTSSVYLAEAPGATNPRAYSPAAPIGFFGGAKFTF